VRIHRAGFLLALMAAVSIFLLPRPLVVFVVLAALVCPMFFNMLFHVGATVLFSSYSPGLATSRSRGCAGGLVSQSGSGRARDSVPGVVPRCVCDRRGGTHTRYLHDSSFPVFKDRGCNARLTGFAQRP
jgi:hypothetical protein